MRNFRSRCPQIMIPCKEVEVSQISRKERKKENISGEVGVVISRWSNLLIDPCNFSMDVSNTLVKVATCP